MLYLIEGLFIGCLICGSIGSVLFMIMSYENKGLRQRLDYYNNRTIIKAKPERIRELLFALNNPEWVKLRAAMEKQING